MQNSARMILPYDITDASMTSSIAEDDHPVWAAGTAYAVGAKVIRNHVIYEAVQASTGIDPATDNGAKWSKGLATNRWKPFDTYLQDQASASESATWTITPSGVATGVALFGVEAATVRVKMTDATAGVVYDNTIDLIDSTAIATYTDWFFKPVERQNQAVLTNLPPYPAPVEVTIATPGGTAKVGQIVIGYAEDLGIALNGLGVGINDYSRKQSDDFGRVSPVERGFASKLTPIIGISTARLNYIVSRFAARRAKPTVYSFDSKYRPNDYAAYGFYERFDVLAQYANITELNLTINGLV